MVANAVAPKPNVKAAVTPMNMIERRMNTLPGSAEIWMLTTTPWLKLFSPGKGVINENAL
jgi:hypothetical protein